MIEKACEILRASINFLKGDFLLKGEREYFKPQPGRLFSRVFLNLMKRNKPEPRARGRGGNIFLIINRVNVAFEDFLFIFKLEFSFFSGFILDLLSSQFSWNGILVCVASLVDIAWNFLSSLFLLLSQPNELRSHRKRFRCVREAGRRRHPSRLSL